MSATKTFPPGAVVPASPLRLAAAAILQRAGAALSFLAARLTATPPRRGPPVLEFHAEAGAPEGALYVDGQLVGYVPGVLRL